MPVLAFVKFSVRALNTPMAFRYGQNLHPRTCTDVAQLSFPPQNQTLCLMAF